MKKTITLSLVFLCSIPFLSSGQNLLRLDECSNQNYEINDHQDIDGDGNVCEAKLILTKSAFYTEGQECALSSIQWNVIVDLWKDGTDDLEFNSNLPITDTSWDDTNGNGIPDVYVAPTINNELQSIQLPDIDGPLSQHGIRWKVTDDCDLGDLCSSSFFVEDKKPPTPFCVSLTTILFEPPFGNGFEIFAEDFVVGTFDNCTPEEELTYSFSSEEVIASRTLNCNDVINSPVHQDIFVSDNRGNVSSCTVILNVIPGPTVDCEEHIDIFGKVTDWKGNVMEGVEVKLEGDLPEFPLTKITDEAGNYSFGQMPIGVDYTISASFEEPHVVGLTTLDLVLIQRYLLSLQEFSNPYRIVACDINQDNKVSVLDLLMHRKLILGIIDEVEDAPAWRFMDADFEFEDETDPFMSIDLPDANPFEIKPVVSILEGFNFVGIKTGDVND